MRGDSNDRDYEGKRLREKAGLRDQGAGGRKSKGGGDKIMSIFMCVEDGANTFIAITNCIIITTNH